jgi:hypothetical protein
MRSLGKFMTALFVAAFIMLAGVGSAVANITLVAPASLIGQTIFGASGAQYSTDAAGYFSAANSDVGFFLAAGFTLPPAGLAPTPLRFIDFKNTDGTTLSATASAGKFGLAITAGTSEVLNGEAATGNTKTDAAAYEFVLPANYHAGSNLTLTIYAKYSGSGTAGTKTVAAAAYLTAVDGTQGSTLIATSAQTATTSNAAYAFTVTGTTLVPGSRLLITVTSVMQETGGSSSLTLAVNSGTIG